MNVLCQICDVEEKDLQKADRSKSLSDARKIYYYLATKLQGKSNVELAKKFGRCRTSIIHGLKVTNDLIIVDSQFSKRVDLIERMVLIKNLSESDHNLK